MTGLRFLPLRPGSNIPAIKNWQNVASADHDQHEEWLRQIPGCNWGVLTGNGVGVLDLDTKNAPEGDPGGFGSLIDVEQLLGIDLSGLPLVQTASGAHLYFRYDGHLPSKVPWVPYLDVKADGGHQVAAPGTIRDVPGGQRVYTLLRGSLQDIPFAPAPLLEAIRKWRTGRTGVGGGSPSPGADLPSTEDAIKYGLPNGARDDFMHRLACRWWSKLGLEAEADVHALAWAVWSATAGHDTFPWSDAEKCVRSAFEFVATQREANMAIIAQWLEGADSKPVRRMNRRRASDYAPSNWREANHV